MMRGMFAAISGLKTHQVMLDVTSNDIANVNTIGYKSARTTFKDSLTQLQRGASGPGGGTGGANAAQIGLGTQLGSIDNLMTSGALQSHGQPARRRDPGPRLLPRGVQRRDRRPRPTRPTSSTPAPATSRPTAQGYLVTQDGYYVQGLTPGAAGAADPDTLLQIPPGATNVAIGQNGDVSYIDPARGTRTTAGYISLATFANSAGLERSGNNRWLESANSGGPTIGTPATTLGFTTAGAIEMSNVDLAQSFTSMITAQRGFQANSRVISVSDEMLSDLVNLKR